MQVIFITMVVTFGSKQFFVLHNFKEKIISLNSEF